MFLEGIPDPNSLDSLLSGLSMHGDAMVRAGCATHLVRFADDERTVDALVAATDDADADVRRTVAEALGQCGGGLAGAARDKASACLTARLRDTHVEVRVQARAALDAMGIVTD